MSDVQFDIDLEGVDDVLKKLGIMGDIDSSEIIIQALLRCGKQVEATAKDLLDEKIYHTPPSPTYVRTGLLRRQTLAEPRVEHTREGLVERVKAKTYYAVYVELGTSKMPARAFLLPAMQNNENFILETLSKAVADYLKEKMQ